MNKMYALGVGLTKGERKRVTLFLKRFIRYVEPGKLVVCGGLATRYHLASHGFSPLPRPFNDIDLLVEKVGDIKSSITSEFMIYHYHPPGRDDPVVKKNYFFYAFVDPVTRMKADVFPYRWSRASRFVDVPFLGTSMSIVGIEDQLIQCLYDVSRISQEQKVDPKQLEDVHILLKIADLSVVKQIWKKNHHPSYPRMFKTALARADNLREKKSEWWQSKPYRKPKPYKCAHCQNRPDYPLTNMSTIYKILRYIE